jgi:hypothetical protein
MTGILSTPAAYLWRAFFILLACCLLPIAHAQAKRYRPQPEYTQVSVPDQEKGRGILTEFRKLGIVGDYYFEFDLRMLPRRGEELRLKGQLWGGLREAGYFYRVVIKENSGEEHRFVILNGPKPSAWVWKRLTPGEPHKLSVEELFAPIAGTVLSPFDLQMPYLHWSEFAFEGLATVRGRFAYRFILYPPAEIAAAQTSLCGVRMSLDSQFKALVESELIGDGEKVLRTFSLQEFKKTADQWIPRTIEVRDEASRSKTRLTVTAAAMRQNFADGIFEAAALPQDITPPLSKNIEYFK